MSNWGQGVINNAIEWGKGAINNAIGWGIYYLDSWAGDTEIYGYNANAAAFFTAVEDAGGTLSDTVKLEFSNFVQREEDAGRWVKIKRLYPYLGGVINSARIDAITLASATNNNFVDADADATCGLQGDGSTKSLVETSNTNTVFSSMFDVQCGMFLIGGTVSSGNYFMSSVDSVDNEWIAIRSVTASNTLRVYQGGIATTADGGNIANTNSLICARYSNSSLIAYRNGVAGTENTATITTSLPTSPFGYFSFNATGNYQAVKAGGSFLAEGMNAADVVAFEASYKTFLTNIGVI